MAKEVKETPVLTGKEAERFTKAIQENEHKRVPEEDYARAMTTYEQVMKASKLG